MGEIRESKEYKTLEKALTKRMKDKLGPARLGKKVKPDTLVKDLVRRYMSAWELAELSRQDIDASGHYCIDDRGRRYNNPSVKSLQDAEAMMSRLLRDMEIKTEDLAAALEDEDDEL